LPVTVKADADVAHLLRSQLDVSYKEINVQQK